jgi:hypothetical protein
MPIAGTPITVVEDVMDLSSLVKEIAIVYLVKGQIAVYLRCYFFALSTKSTT